jgi:hypothetical protein
VGVARLRERLPLVSGTEFVRSTHTVDCSGSRLVLPRPEAK